ncbi:MAG TPA: DNA polymerase III subunit alpha [Candidatus Sulfotelmatobacter sp.]|jgi:DNA polymerase-3 subunit alpha|nr:DNA polymerase III subunit alpha [Candidatus Sulfotelmatobacter sp.]
MADFVHLHNHTEYSLLDGLQKTKNMVEYARGLGMKAIAITDHGNMYGTIKFYKACLDAGIKPIIGCEIYVAKRSLKDKDGAQDKEYNHLILLAENETGYKNLMKIVTVSHLEGYYYKPRVDLKLLEQYHEGLICLSACVNGYVSEPFLRNEDSLAEERAIKLSQIFGSEHFYLELQQHIDVPPQKIVNQKLVQLSKKLGLPIVATNDNHYTSKDDAEAQEILLCVQTQTTILDKKRKLSMVSSPDFYIKTAEEMEKLFIDLPDAIDNANKIAERCNVEITLGKWHMPIFEVPDDMTITEYLTKLVYEGAKKRYNELSPAIKERIDYELSVIIKKKYETYFLVVADFVNWAKDNGIAVGPGRGSAAGSVVSYALKITDADPFFFNLPFERFLNPLRPSAPDIDLDFADTRREEVIEYVTKKYGKDKVAQIITFGTMEAKGSVRDTGRALGMPYVGPDRISKMIPPGWQGHGMTIENALQQSPDLKRAYDSEPETKRLLDLAKKLEGVARHASIHAAGVVIADKPLTEYTPLQKETNGEKIVTQYDMYTVGEDGVGLLKMDFLGLRNLTIIEECLKFTKENQGKEIDLNKVDLEDKKTYKLLSEGETTGIFQLESTGMRRYIKELKPTTIFDLQAMVALYRPGPMAIIPEFIKRKHNPSLITYPDPRLKDILKQSYGVLTYQDDVLLTAIALAGYSWLEADKFRKAMGKKITSEMKKQKELFTKGCVENGLTPKRAEEFFELIAPFAGYGFNKAHAACYAIIAFRTAYLKANHPVEFMTALLTAESRGTSGPIKNEKVAQAVLECKRLDIPVLLPDINKSQSDFSIEDRTKIRFGISAIKNVGDAAIQNIIEARKEKIFISFQDFCLRVNLSTINKKTMESLIKAGSMDSFGNRASMLVAFPEIVLKINQIKKQKADGQKSLFDDDLVDNDAIDFNLTEIEDFTDEEKLQFEKEFLGIYLTSHPHLEKLSYLKSFGALDFEELETKQEGIRIRIGGILDNVKRIFTKKGSEMAFLSLVDEKGLAIECVVFPKTFEIYKNILIKDSVVVLDGKLDTKNDKPTILVDTVTQIDTLLLDLPSNSN